MSAYTLRHDDAYPVPVKVYPAQPSASPLRWTAKPRTPQALLGGVVPWAEAFEAETPPPPINHVLHTLLALRNKGWRARGISRATGLRLASVTGWLFGVFTPPANDATLLAKLRPLLTQPVVTVVHSEDTPLE